jgi:hypothetical protein
MSAPVPTGTTGDVAITFSGNDSAASRIFVFATDDAALFSKIPSIGYNSVTSSTAATAQSQASSVPGGFGISILSPLANAGAAPVPVNGVNQPAFSVPSSGATPSVATGLSNIIWNWPNSISAAVAMATWR